MLSQEDIVDNFFMFANSKATTLYPNNNNNSFSVNFPHRKDLGVNDAWEVAVTSLSIPYWLTNPDSSNTGRRGDAKWIKIAFFPDRTNVRNKAVKTIHAQNGYYLSRGDYIEGIKLEQPILVTKDSTDTMHTIDIDNYFKWIISPATNRFILDTSAIFDDYPECLLRVQFGPLVRKALQPKSGNNLFIHNEPIDHRLRSSTRDRDDSRDGYYYKHEHQVLVHSNLTGSTENPQKIVFHSADINNPANHTQYGTVNLFPNRLEYHKVSLENFTHIDFKITDCNGHAFNWLHDIPASIGLHFRKRYYINVYK